MTILEALTNKSPYPISTGFVESVGIDRDLTVTDEYSKVIGISQSYELATADILIYLHDAPNLVEQEVGINNAADIKKELLNRANKIYSKYDDPKYSGSGTFGFIGDDWNV